MDMSEYTVYPTGANLDFIHEPCETMFVTIPYNTSLSVLMQSATQHNATCRVLLQRRKEL